MVQQLIEELLAKAPDFDQEPGDGIVTKRL
jgi:hypothetical protein